MMDWLRKTANRAKPFLGMIVLAACVRAEVPVGAPPAGAPLEPGLYAVMNTSMGQITARLFEQDRPLSVAHFVALATGAQAWVDPKTGAPVNRPLYDNLLFNRVIPDYVIQTGDPTDTGRYDCGVEVKDERVPELTFDRPGRLGIVNAGAPDTGGCQFFITDDAYPSLDPSAENHGYTVFGQVVSGQDIVDRISRVPHDEAGKPREAVKLISVKISRIGLGPAAPPAGRSGRVTRRVPIPD